MADGPSYTAGYRAEAADFAAASGKPIAQVAADLGINEKTLGRWVTVRKKELTNHPVAAAASACASSFSHWRPGPKNLSRGSGYSASAKPLGLWLCQFQLSRHISAMSYWAFQPIMRSALEASHQLAAMSPARRSRIT